MINLNFDSESGVLVKMVCDRSESNNDTTLGNNDTHLIMQGNRKQHVTVRKLHLSTLPLLGSITHVPFPLLTLFRSWKVRSGMISDSTVD